jgi:23S rRNA-/tRNA-specific pseudouridylate synthase
LLAKSPGAVETFGGLFESRRMAKTYLAVVRGAPKEAEWTCRLKLGPDLRMRGRMRVDPREGKDSETSFRVLQPGRYTSLVEARPLTGRTHQIRVHLAEGGLPIVGDELYGADPPKAREEFGLRAVELSYTDPFTKRAVRIVAPSAPFCREYRFNPV